MSDDYYTLYDAYEDDDPGDYIEDVLDDYSDEPVYDDYFEPAVIARKHNNGIAFPIAVLIWLAAAVLGLALRVEPIERIKTMLSAPTVIDLPDIGKYDITVSAKISWYNPALGGTNCAKFVNGKCVSKTASGQPWEPWMGRGAACPKEFPFGTIFVVDGKEWVCVDRGGKITYLPDGTFWLDLMNDKAVYPYGTVVTVTVRYP